MTEVTYEVTVRLDDEDCDLPTERDVQVAVEQRLKNDPGFDGVKVEVQVDRL